MKALLLHCLLTILLCQCAQHPPQTPVETVPQPDIPPTTTAVCSYMPAELCYLDEVVPGICVDLKYCGSDNFVGRPIDGYTTGCRAILRRDMAERLAKVQNELATKGLALKVWDAYRPHRATLDFLSWFRTPDEARKAIFYPNITKQGILENRFISRRSAHSYGLAVDVTLIQLETGQELDMGGRHDLLDASSATRYAGITAEQQANRLLLLNTMGKAGFLNYRKEWWHFFRRNDGTATRYDFPLNDHLIPQP